ncbi:MAG: methylated-DNA--[protein]-cysteine S-methyltransferase [Alphaproteobacteria bacterium]|nr:methylated-DNA--[protein]-cysteine S-methyltransferase [Alphaproteobacteria bacterium]
MKNGTASNEPILFSITKTSFGPTLIAQSAKGICAILFEKDARSLKKRFPKAVLKPGAAKFEKQIQSVLDFIENRSNNFNIPLDIRGTEFQRDVWKAVRKIPKGSTASYSDIARKIGSPKAARAVAQACASNNLAIVIPCHRIIRNDGKLCGYSWGIRIKKELLRQESILTTLQH